MVRKINIKNCDLLKPCGERARHEWTNGLLELAQDLLDLRETSYHGIGWFLGT